MKIYSPELRELMIHSLWDSRIFVNPSRIR
jgi:hypothetical protein